MASGKSRQEAEASIISLFPDDEDYGPTTAAKQLDIARTLSWEIVEKNDDRCSDMTPEKRYGEVLKWVRSQIRA